MGCGVSTEPLVLTLKIPGGGATYNFAPLYPLWGRDFTVTRDDEQGPAFHKIQMSMKFSFMSVVGSHKECMDRYLALESFLRHGNLILNHSVGATVLSTDRLVYVGGLSKPENWDTWNGECSFNIYYFQDATDHFGADGLEISASYVYNGGTYTFAKAPTWQRSVKPNRGSHRAVNAGSTATITLTGKLVGSSHSDLMSKVTVLESAFRKDGTLNYGSLSIPCRTVGTDIPKVFPKGFCPYSISLAYDLDEIIRLRARTNIPRIHHNPVVKEKPLCDTRVIQLMNRSSQTITYNVSIVSDSIAAARMLLATELASRIFPGGVEMPGGEEVWDEDEVSVSCTVIKLYDTPVVENLAGTGE